MSLLNSKLHLFCPTQARGVLRLPIDIFFKSVAMDRMEKSIGFILFGLGSDGTLGLIAIKENDGVAIVQNPATAKFDSMPRSALEMVVPDLAARVEDIPNKMLALLKFSPPANG